MASTVGRIVVRTAGGSEEYALASPSVVIGRSTASDIVVADPRASRVHARLDSGKGGCTLVDLGSANGTRVNGTRVERATLADGDTIGIGDAELRYEAGPPPTGPPAPDITRIETAADLDATIAGATLTIRLNRTETPRLAVQLRDAAWEVPLGRDPVTIGRDPSCDVVLDDPQVSRRHARIERRGDVLVLRDAGSRNGTWVASHRIAEVVLRPGTTAGIGGARLVFKPGFAPDDLTLVERPGGSGPAGRPRRPVVFVPGLMGSELWRGSERIWPNTHVLLADPEILRVPGRETLRPGAVVGEVVVVPNLVKVQAYRRMGDYLVDGLGYERGRDLLEFGYDWRQDVRDSARLLARAIDGWRADGPVTIVAHSLGCLVSRWYVERLGGRSRVDRLVLMGGPHRGTPGALAGLVLGPRILPFGLMGDRLRALAATFPSSYQILPTYPCVVEGGGRHVDVLADDAWPDGPQRSLVRAAREFAAQLGAASSVPATSIFGYGGRTVVAMRGTRDERSGWSRLEAVAGPDGDGSVPVASAILAESDIHPVRQEHGALFVDGDVKMRLKLELTGEGPGDAGSGRALAAGGAAR
ncbi:MAG: FHA domain-containing protein [Chloroflexi bacterium]|nr:FHA domain-containing protein [Chloroflexota bacterium]